MYTQHITLEKNNYTFFYDDKSTLFAILNKWKASKELLKFICNKFDENDCDLYNHKNELNTPLVDYLLTY